MNGFWHLRSYAAAVALLLSAGVAQAQTGPWSLSFDLGGQLAVNGDVHDGATGSVLGLPTVVEPRSYGDVYGTGFYWAATLGYRLGENGEFRIQGNYTNNPAERLQVGTVAGLPAFGLFDDYNAFGMDFGYRHYFGAARVRPFLGAGGGFVRLAEVDAEFSVPAAGVTLPGVDFLDSSIVPAFGVNGGVQVRLSDRLSAQGGIDFRWHGDAQDRDGLAGTGLEAINDATRRWAMPITAGLTVRF
jgi:hypothetical protein